MNLCCFKPFHKQQEKMNTLSKSLVHLPMNGELLLLGETRREDPWKGARLSGAHRGQVNTRTHNLSTVEEIQQDKERGWSVPQRTTRKD